MADLFFSLPLTKQRRNKMKDIETLWANGEITNNGAREAIKARKALQMFEKALLFYNTSELSWKKCVKKAQSETIPNPMWRDL